MEKKLPSRFRAIVFLLSLALILVLYLPIWKIELSAPQYPEGLTLKIYASHIGGDVDVVNGLNHYIGMHALHTRDFVEFIALPYIIGGFALLGFLVFLVNRRKAFYTWAFLFLLLAATSMLDFYRWEYNYGHNLDPQAPIQVPGMAYQPPLLGYKQLLNFGAYSIPDSGGRIFVGVGVVMAGLLVFDWLGTGQHRRRPAHMAAALLLLCVAFQGCTTGPQPIAYGQDNCSYCKMTFADKRFGGEICTRKGKVYKFDDIHCLLASLQEGTPAREDIGTIYLLDFTGGGWIESSKAYLLKCPGLHTPMGGNTAAFASRETLQHSDFNGQQLLWKDLYR